MSHEPREPLVTMLTATDSAGIPMEDLRGSLTAVYGASMIDDWTLMAAKDAETVPRMSITGNAASLLPNKISWFFDLRGPSIHVDTACSSGLSAIDLACQSILSGNAKAVCTYHSQPPAPYSMRDFPLSRDPTDQLTMIRPWSLGPAPS